MSDRIEDFVIEAREHLCAFEESLLALEKHPKASGSSSHYDRCFRSIHSIKGDAGFLGVQSVHQLAHAMESLLSATPQPLPARVIETLLVARDRLAALVDDPARSHLVDLTEILKRLEVTGPEKTAFPFDIDLTQCIEDPSQGISRFVRELSTRHNLRKGQLQIATCNLRAGLPSGPVRWTGIADTLPAIHVSLWQPGLHVHQISANLQEIAERTGSLTKWFQQLTEDVRVVSGRVMTPERDLRSGLPMGPVPWFADCQTRLSPEELSRRFGVQAANPAESTAAHPESRAIVETRTSETSSLVAGTAKALSVASGLEAEKPTTLRIQVELLDRLMTLVGELTLVRNQSLLAFAEEDGTHRAIIQRLNSVTSELQDTTLRARMQPVGNLFNRFPRMVRDLARQFGKQVEIELEGLEVELDKTILEQLSDPLMHLIRNSMDHGIEMPSERMAKGKSPVGHIVLSATHDDGQVQIEIRDDGKGIDSEAVKNKALQLRLRSEAELARMSQRELLSLILLPGFSTARNVTEVSGRGVGMDVVKTNIEHLEGTITLVSTVDQGCTTILRMPLTLAIIPSLIVTVAKDRFAVPQREVEEVVCLYPQSPCRIEKAFDTEVYRLREKLLPIVRLKEVLNRREPFTAQAKADIIAAHATQESRSHIEYLLVLKCAGRRYGLVVDDVHGTQEIVVKPLHASMKRIGIFTGSTIMGDGRVALIADSEGIAEHARLSFDAVVETTKRISTVRDAAQVHRVLLFEYGSKEQFALPLIQIRRIEMLSPDRIEQAGDQEYVTVDGVSLRILRLDKVINVSSVETDPPLMSLILPKFLSQPTGILVSRIVDTESLSLDLQPLPDQDPGILGAAIVRERLTLFLDLHRLTETLFGTHAATPTASRRSSRPSHRILLIDDTAFFREVVKRYLEAEGHEIATAVHGEDGLAQLASGRQFDLIVSDIEMPVMDGWEFAVEARRRGIRTPMLALTSLSGTQYETQAKECGFDSYEVKLDHDRLIRKVENLLAGLETLA